MATEHETRRLPGSAESGAADPTVIDVKPADPELPEQKGAVLGGDPATLDRETRISNSLTDDDTIVF